MQIPLRLKNTGEKQLKHEHQVPVDIIADYPQHRPVGFRFSNRAQLHKNGDNTRNNIKQGDQEKQLIQPVFIIKAYHIEPEKQVNAGQ